MDTTWKNYSKGGHSMGAIEQDGYRFEVEYSLSHQKGALHVYKDGEFIEELAFPFTGEKPNEEEINTLVDTYLQDKL